MALKDSSHNLLEKNRELLNQCGSDHTNTNSKPTVSNLKIHSGLNLLNSNTKVVYSTIFGTKETTGNLFFYIPGIMKIETEGAVDTREQFFNIPPKNYTTKNDQLICVDLYVKYQVTSAIQSYQSSQNVISSIMEDVRTLVDEYISSKNDDFFDTKRKISMIDLNQSIIKNIEIKYGIKLIEVTSNNISNPLKRQINETAKKEEARRIQAQKNQELQLTLEKNEAETRMNIEKKRLEIDKKELKMISQFVNASKNADALARMYSNRNGNSSNQDVDVHHHSK